MIKGKIIRHTAVFLTFLYCSMVSAEMTADLMAEVIGGVSPSNMMGLCSCLPKATCKNKNLDKLAAVILSLKEAITKYGAKANMSQCYDANTLMQMGLIPQNTGTECLDIWLNAINPFKILTTPNSQITGSFNTCEEFHKILVGILNLRLPEGYAAIEGYLANKAQNQPMPMQPLPAQPFPFPPFPGQTGACSNNGPWGGAPGMFSPPMFGGMGGQSSCGSGAAFGEFEGFSPSNLIDILSFHKANTSCPVNGELGPMQCKPSNNDMNPGPMRVSLNSCCSEGPDINAIMMNALREQQQIKQMRQPGACPINPAVLMGVAEAVHMNALTQQPCKNKPNDIYGDGSLPPMKVTMGGCCRNEGMLGGSLFGGGMNGWNSNLGLPSGLGMGMGSGGSGNICAMEELMKGYGNAGRTSAGYTAF
ncbi:hypothetical protein NEMIN01_2279 [Nematocida minor]|uniref:uncharacterized protein n=1 Tax=Nematocida minor TaxID=1912983 RepID=UPI00221F5CB7|nr:uncharacterized protein NEMIN01_2279 [Nematocida minor]KAI5192904.1 hypothetical protein NEMIN01_2279 [Nematocida minor]